LTDLHIFALSLQALGFGLVLYSSALDSFVNDDGKLTHLSEPLIVLFLFVILGIYQILSKAVLGGLDTLELYHQLTNPADPVEGLHFQQQSHWG
jgi:nitrate reductase NapE component